MAKVIIYSTKYCPYCVRAKDLLTRKGIAFKEIMIDEDSEKREEMVQKSGRMTVPQIFINNKPIGGFDDLYALQKKGQLDQLLLDEDEQ